MGAPEASGFNLGTLQLEYMAAFFFHSTALGILLAAGNAATTLQIFVAYGIGGQCGLLCVGADFNPSVSLLKFLLSEKRDVMKLLCRMLGQFLGCLCSCLGLWLMCADWQRTGFFPPMLNQADAFSAYNGFFAIMLASGPGLWLLEAYGSTMMDRRLAHFVTYGYQAAWQMPLVGNGFNWADALARGVMGYITGDALGVKGGFKGGDFIESMWMILLAGGIAAPAFAWFFTKIQWPMIVEFSEKEMESQKDEPSAAKTTQEA